MATDKVVLKRMSGVELPSAVELLDILKKESTRHAVRFDYIQKSPDLFGSHANLATLAGVSSEWHRNYERLTLEELVNRINHTHEIMSRYIVNHPEKSDLYGALFGALAVDEEARKCDAVFVFGAASNVRMETAVQLYEKGIAKKIIASGKGPHYSQVHTTEAQRMADFAVQAGVARDNLILEDESVTLPDNVKRTIDMMQAQYWQPKRLCIVATNFVLRRAVMEWYKFTPWEIEIIPVSANVVSPHFHPGTWFKSQDSISLVLNEYAKLVIESKIDLMRRDGEVAY